jgi:hypothetical protein
MAHLLVRIGATQATYHHLVLHLQLLMTSELAKVQAVPLHCPETLGRAHGKAVPQFEEHLGLAAVQVVHPDNHLLHQPHWYAQHQGH